MTEIGHIEQTNRSLSSVNSNLGGELLKQIDSLEASGSPYTILDLASGSNFVSAQTIAKRYPKAKVYAIDLELKGLSMLPNLHLRKESAFNLSISSKKVNLVYSVGLVYWYERIGRYDRVIEFIWEVARVLALGGVALIDLPASIIEDKLKIEVQEIEKQLGVKIFPQPTQYPWYMKLIDLIQLIKPPPSYFIKMVKKDK